MNCRNRNKSIKNRIVANNTTTLRNLLANLAHSQWSGWMSYLFDKSILNEDGTVTMPKWAVERWKRQIETQYDDLSEAEKENDLTEADKVLSLINKFR